MTGRVVVTGATGFLGRQAVPALLASGWDVHALARRLPSTVDTRVTWHEVDLLADGPPGRLLREIAAEHLLHLAWCAEPGRFWTDPANLSWTVATAQLVRAFASAGGRRIVGAGSCAEYDWEAGWCREATPLRPATLYGAAKAATGTLLTAWGPRADVRIAWGRLFHLYGPGEPPGKLVGSVVSGLRAGRIVPLSRGEQLRDFLHTRDAAAALVAILDSELDGPINVASGQPVKVRDLVLMLGEAAGSPHLLRFGERPPVVGEPPLLAGDVSLLNSIGWSPNVDLREGLADLLASDDA